MLLNLSINLLNQQNQRTYCYATCNAFSRNAFYKSAITAHCNIDVSKSRHLHCTIHMIKKQQNASLAWSLNFFMSVCQSQTTNSHHKTTNKGKRFFDIASCIAPTNPLEQFVHWWSKISVSIIYMSFAVCNNKNLMQVLVVVGFIYIFLYLHP